MLAGDVVLIIVFLQNQLVSYADGSAGHDQSGLQCLDPPTQREKSVPQLRRGEVGAGLGASGQPSPCRPAGPDRRFFQTLGRVERGTNSSELTSLIGSVLGKVPGDTSPPKPC